MASSPRIKGLVRLLQGLPRSQRVSLNMFCSVILTMVFGYLIRIAFFDSPEANFTPYWLGVSLIALLVSGMGWFLLVGIDEDWRAMAVAVYFVLFSALGLLLIFLGLLAGLVFGFVL